jgi:DNA-binding response OmpR family regulator
VKQKVLVVDDDAAILEVLEMRLTAMGFDVIATSDPRRALEATEAGRFDLALLDLRMEPTDGMRLMEGLHARQPRLPVLIMTAHATIQTAVEAVRRGAFDYLTKPFVRDELRSKIARTLATRRWARDRERLLTVGQALASSGVMARVLDSVAQATVEATDADRCVVFQLEQGRLVPMASAGSPPTAWHRLEAAASAAMDKGMPITMSGAAEAPTAARSWPRRWLFSAAPPARSSSRPRRGSSRARTISSCWRCSPRRRRSPFATRTTSKASRAARSRRSDAWRRRWPTR